MKAISADSSLRVGRHGIEQSAEKRPHRGQPPRRPARHPSSSEEGSVFSAGVVLINRSI
jgi:hypothetical protein